jgi:hypothetical protein
MSKVIEGNQLMKVERPKPWPPAPVVSSDVPDSPPQKPFFERLWLVGNTVQGLNRRQFEGRLSKLIGSALAHEQEGLPAGSKEYRRLARMADESIASYCTTHLVDRDDLEAQIPAINKLKNLTNPKTPEMPVWLRPSTIIGFCFATAMVAVFLGLDNGLFQAAKMFTIHHLVHQ